MSEPLDDLTEGLWARLRNVLIALDRMDRLETARELAGWVEGFQSDDSQIQATVQAFVLRAVRAASDPINFQILSAVRAAGGTSLAQLIETTRLTRVDLTERLKDLAQVGLIAQAFEMDSAQLTRAGEGMLAWVDAVRERIAERARAGLTKDNPPPRLHRPISNL